MGYIDLKKLNLDELAGVVNLYPWFGGARKELCKRMSREGWGDSQFAEAAMYVAARGKISDMLRSSAEADWADADAENLIRSYIAKDAEAAQEESEQRRVHVVGGDYFSQAEYDRVRRGDSNVFSRYAAKARQENHDDGEAVEFDLYTETLAQIYLEQGYPEQARSIYSKLLLANPEKNAYFAALIQKIDELNQ